MFARSNLNAPAVVQPVPFANAANALHAANGGLLYTVLNTRQPIRDDGLPLSFRRRTTTAGPAVAPTFLPPPDTRPRRADVPDVDPDPVCFEPVPTGVDTAMWAEIPCPGPQPETPSKCPSWVPKWLQRDENTVMDVGDIRLRRDAAPADCIRTRPYAFSPLDVEEVPCDDVDAQNGNNRRKNDAICVLL